MSLKITNLATEKQKAILARLGYVGTGNYRISKLTKEDAAELIDELFEEERLRNLTQGEDYHESHCD